KTGTTVVYSLELETPIREIYYKGAAWAKMTMEVLDDEGQVIASTGPHGGGNVWLEAALKLPDEGVRRFTLRFHNHISTWFFIQKIALRQTATPSVAEPLSP
ncbi:MAG: hypothetical protein N2C14_21950, partial [Planctomycetales bacterium]